jgi:hypothetical protein
MMTASSPTMATMAVTTPIQKARSNSLETGSPRAYQRPARTIQMAKAAEQMKAAAVMVTPPVL